MLIKQRKTHYLLYFIEWLFIWTYLNPIHPKMLCAKFGSGKNVLKFRQYIFTILKLSPLRNSGALHMNRLEYPLPMDNLSQVWLKLAQLFWGRRFLNFVNVFSLFRNYLLLERLGPFVWTNLNPLHPRMFCAKLLKLAQQVEKKTFKFRQCIFTIS